MRPHTSDVCFQDLGPDPQDAFGHFLPLTAHKVGWIFSGICALLASLLAFSLILSHSATYTRPSQQRYIIRILLVVPIYAYASWLSYVFYRHAPYFELFRGIYEAFVISSFFLLTVNYLGERPEEQRYAMLRKQADRRIRLLFPFRFVTVSPNNLHFLQFIKYGILQLVVIKTVTSILAMVLFRYGIYCPENMRTDNARLYIGLINVVSIVTAMYAMMLFYVTMRDDLAPHEPLLKFLSIKIVVIFTFMQAWIIGVLAHKGYIKQTQYWTVDNISTGLQAILTTFEMVFVALLHFRAFPTTPYRHKEMPRTPWAKGLKDAFNPWDVVKEIRYGVKYFWHVFVRRNTQWLEKDAVGRLSQEVEEERAVLLGKAGRLTFTGAMSVDFAALKMDDEEAKHAYVQGVGSKESEQTATNVTSPEKAHLG